MGLFRLISQDWDDDRAYERERDRAIRMVAEIRSKHPHETAAMRHVAGLLGMNTETLRLMVLGAEVDAGQRPGTERPARMLRRSTDKLMATLQPDATLETHPDVESALRPYRARGWQAIRQA